VARTVGSWSVVRSQIGVDEVVLLTEAGVQLGD
jgi:hypothetical protein